MSTTEQSVLAPAVESPAVAPPAAGPPPVKPRRWYRGVPLAIAIGVACVVVLGEALFRHAGAQQSTVTLDAAPKDVTVAAARATTYRASRRYVGTIEPWVEARIGPQVVSAYVATVEVRPGAEIAKGQVVATLDCRQASASNQAMAQQARAQAARHAALADEAHRMSGLLDGGYVSPNEVEQRVAESDAEQARLSATRAQMVGSAVVVDDCVLRAPFAGEVGERTVDPGAFVHPGSAIVSLIDRNTLRVVAEVPETDFDVVAPGTPVKLRVLATGKLLDGTIARRSPAADPSTRTVHVEVDMADAERAIPVHTTAELTIDVGAPAPAEAIPLIAADVRRGKARVYVVKDGVAHQREVAVVGERGGDLFVDPQLGAGAQVVTEGRALLVDGDHVTAHALTGAP